MNIIRAEHTEQFLQEHPEWASEFPQRGPAGRQHRVTSAAGMCALLNWAAEQGIVDAQAIAPVRQRLLTGPPIMPLDRERAKG